MAYCLTSSTSISQPDNLPSQLLLKQRPFKSPFKSPRTFLQEKVQEDEEDDIVLTIVVVGSVSKTTIQVIDLLDDFSFIFRLWRRRIVLIRDENNEKYTTLKDFERAIRNAEVATKEFKQSICKEYYKDEEQLKICLEQKKTLEDALSTVWKEKEKVRFRMTEEDLDRFQSQTVRMCSLLGLQLDFLDYLEKLPQEHRNHRHWSEWIEIFLQENSESLAPADTNSLTRELLQSIGFDPLSTAIETIMERSLAGSTQQHIETCEWAQLFIEDEFKYNPSLSQPKISKFPFQSSITNKWVPLTNTPEEEIESNIDLSRVMVMNVVAEEVHHVLDALRNALSAVIPLGDENITFYHGTDYESACQILFRGIYLLAGRQKRDFSCGKGFYLTTSMEDALNWAKGTTAKPAVLTFVANQRCFDNARKLSLDENDEKWRQIVSSFRTGRRTAITQESIDSYDLIEGPMARVTRDETSRELVFEPKPSSHQMCLISDDFAEEFEQTLNSIVFLDI